MLDEMNKFSVTEWKKMEKWYELMKKYYDNSGSYAPYFLSPPNKIKVALKYVTYNAWYRHNRESITYGTSRMYAFIYFNFLGKVFFSIIVIEENHESNMKGSSCFIAVISRFFKLFESRLEFRPLIGAFTNCDQYDRCVLG